MANDEQTRTVAVVTFFYKGEYLSSLVFDNTETGDAAIATLQEILDFRRPAYRSGARSNRCTTRSLSCGKWMLGRSDCFRPQGTILKLMRIIEAMKSN